MNEGKRYGRLTVLETTRGAKGRLYFRCRCDCGIEKAIRADGVISGAVVSCGCWHKERPRAKVHGYWNKPEYKIWLAIKSRCRRPRDRHFYNYGGRGIDICDAWAASFAAFIRAVGPRPDASYTIERVDNSRGYEPGNVIWTTRKEQQRNRRVNRLMSYRGRIQCVAAWCDEFGVNQATFGKRLRLGWSMHRALTVPIDQRFSTKRRSA
jgi:hypothetical protein